LKKDHDGLGVRRLKEFILALLGKWWWRMLKDTNCIWYRVLWVGRRALMCRKGGWFERWVMGIILFLDRSLVGWCAPTG